jgi:XTP/dITP diphosphohydrolase
LKLVLATHNQGKTREFAKLLGGCGIELLSLTDCGVCGVPEETGRTFLENARIKALAAVKAAGLPSLADDSGLCVDALDGRPGVDSANYDIPWLLAQMEGKTGRRAAFVCRLVLICPDGREFLAEGRCEGEISASPRGNGGFGYDPVFFLPEKGLSMAELTAEEKNAISHRGQAIQKLLKFSPIIDTLANY